MTFEVREGLDPLVRSSVEMPTDHEKPAHNINHDVPPEPLGVNPTGHGPPVAPQSLPTKDLHASQNEQDDPDQQIAVLLIK